MYHNSRLKLHQSQPGNTLVEVMIAGTVLVFVLVAVVSGLILATRGGSFAQQQALATRRAQEGIELFRGFQFQLGWESFYDVLRADGANFSYCLNTLPTTPVAFRDMTARSCTITDVNDRIAGSFLVRQVNVSLPDLINNDEARVTVVVSWQDAGDVRSAQLTQILRKW
jgi:type II secretory pathway pseudopilin PulG